MTHYRHLNTRINTQEEYNPYNIEERFTQQSMPGNVQQMYPNNKVDHTVGMHDFCKKHMLHYIMMDTNDGNRYDGIIEKVDRDHVYLLVPVGDQNNNERLDQHDEENRFGFGFPLGGLGFGFGFPFRFARFRRFRYPFAGVRSFFFPFF